MAERLTCPVCGYQFEIGPEGACGHCPLHSDCAMACCPACGHSTINPQQSRWVQWLEKWFSPRRDAPPVPVQGSLKVHVTEEEIISAGRRGSDSGPPPDLASLEDIAVGESIRVDSFSPSLSLQHQLRLQAFGVEPGHILEVIQQHPVTIVKVDHTELAVERVLARSIFVAPTGASRSG